MTPTCPDTLEARAVRLSCAAPQFQRMADGLVFELRRAMGVPDRAELEVEQEFAALRESLQAFYPDFTALYSGLLSRYLGAASAVVIAALDTPAVQAYLRVAERIEADVATALRLLVAPIAEALTAQPDNDGAAQPKTAQPYQTSGAARQ